MPLLVEAPRRIAEHFGPHRALVLEATVYPDDGSQHLYLRVQVDDSFEEANARHDRLDEEWWLGAMVAARAQLTVDVELT